MFKLSHVVLYTKGLYHHTKDIWRDLRFALTLDGYSGEFFKNKDIVRKLIQECSTLDSNYFTMDQIYVGIQKTETFKFGYIHKDTPHIYLMYMSQHDIDNLPQYDIDLAFLGYLLSGLRFLEKGTWKPTRPVYGKKLGKPYTLSNETINNMFSV